MSKKIIVKTLFLGDLEYPNVQSAILDFLLTILLASATLLIMWRLLL